MAAYRWWGGGRFGEPERRLSVLEIYNSGTLDLRLAGLLWLIMENRASVLVASRPMLAGKTTLFNILLDFLPPDVKQIELQGMFEDFSFLKETVPSQTYLVASEFSGDRIEYMWGDTALRAFQLLDQGYSIGGTIHARTASEALYLLRDYLEVPVGILGKLDVVVTLRAVPGRGRYADPVRRIDSVSLILPHDKGVLLEMIVSRELGTDKIIFAGEKELQSALSRKFALNNTLVAREISRREEVLGHLLEEGKSSDDEVRDAIAGFYRSHSH